jgi:membrane protease YdiL (CAAX protease family)
VAWVRRHPIATFLLITYAWSWCFWIPMALRGQVVRPGALPTHFPGLLGPMVGAFATTALIGGRAGVRSLAASMVRWRVGRRWAIVAIASPLAFLAAAFVVTIATGKPLPPLSAFERYTGFPESAVPLVYLAALVANGFGEETGWRGFLLPQLSRRRSPLAATLCLVPFWATWHVPIFFLSETYRALSPPMFAGFLLGLACGAIVLTQVYNRTGGSVLMAALWHTSYNMTSTTEAGRGTIAAVVSALIMIWAIVDVVMELAARRGGRSVLSSARCDPGQVGEPRHA